MNINGLFNLIFHSSAFYLSHKAFIMFQAYLHAFAATSFVFSSTLKNSTFKNVKAIE